MSSSSASASYSDDGDGVFWEWRGDQGFEAYSKKNSKVLEKRWAAWKGAAATKAKAKAKKKKAAPTVSLTTPAGKYTVDFAKMEQEAEDGGAAPKGAVRKVRAVRRSTPRGRAKARRTAKRGGGRRMVGGWRGAANHFYSGPNKSYWQWEEPVGSGAFVTYGKKEWVKIEKAYKKFLKRGSSSASSASASSASGSSSVPRGAPIIAASNGKKYYVSFKNMMQHAVADPSVARPVRRLEGTPKRNPPPPPPPVSRRGPPPPGRSSGSWSPHSGGIRVRPMSPPPGPDPYTGPRASHWGWEDPVGSNQFTPFTLKQTGLIETGYQKWTAGRKASKAGGGKPKKVKVIIKAAGSRYAIAFADMEQRLVADKTKTRPIRRLRGPHPDLASSSDSGSSSGSGSYSYSS